MDSNTRSYAEVMSACVDACQRCHRSCVEEATRLLEASPGMSTSKLFASLVACIGVTRVTAEMILMDAGTHEEACQLCAATCRTCANLCLPDAALEECMKRCLECARCCEMAGEKVAA